MRGCDPVDPALRGGNRVGMAGSSKTGALAAWVSANRWISILLTVAAAMMVFAIVAPWIAPGDPTEVVLSERYLPLWSDGHALGTDHLGRDYHSRLIVGGRLSIMAGLIPAFGAMVAGLVIGMTSGYFGGWVDSVLMRIIDVLLAFPFLLLVILMVAVLGTDIRNAMIALMIGGTPGTARTLRSLVLSIKQRPFVEAAEVSGLGGWRIIRYEIFPNVLPLAVALMTIQMSWMIVAIAGLSFLGLGVRPPDADWGTLIADARGHIFRAPYLALIPSVLVAMVSFVFFVLGDALQRTLGEERVR